MSGALVLAGMLALGVMIGAMMSSPTVVAFTRDCPSKPAAPIMRSALGEMP